jgi:hypothetical protein
MNEKMKGKIDNFDYTVKIENNNFIEFKLNLFKKNKLKISIY